MQASYKYFGKFPIRKGKIKAVINLHPVTEK